MGISNPFIIISTVMLLLLLLLFVAEGFTPSRDNHSNISSRNLRLYNIIEAQTEEFVAPKDGAIPGGVSLAKESALKIIGSIEHKPGKAESFPETLLRYNTLSTVGEVDVQDVLNKVGSTVICMGQGIELYKDPGETVTEEVYYAPMEAIKDAFTNAASAMESTNLIFNFLGGDELMLGEVIEAANELVVMLDIPTKATISFNSLSHKTIPSTACTITVVSVPENNDVSSFSGVGKAVALGEVYALDGNWYTADENTALA